ncbi:MAG TPA: hypothetical protein VMB48_10075 [Steroidobacteraceae bacterium]|nr:hypothetical protein [Steroidobacteraceae bacterium]
MVHTRKSGLTGCLLGLLLCVCARAGGPLPAGDRGPQGGVAPRGEDWKFYGMLGSSLAVPTSYLFFDAGSVTRGADGHVKVWCKGLVRSALDELVTKLPDSKSDAALYARVEQRIVGRYAPPLAAVQPLDENRNTAAYVQTVAMEVIATYGDMVPTIRSRVEFDCRGQRVRSLSVAIASNGVLPDVQESPGEWDQLALRTPGWVLSRVLCAAR